MSEDRAAGGAAEPTTAMRALLDRPMDPAVLDENTMLVAQPHETVDADRFDLLVARIGDEHLGFDAMLAHRVHDLATIRRVPHRHAEHLAGIAAVDGDIVPAGLLSRLLGIPADVDPDAPRIILVGPIDRRWALPVDAVVGVQVHGSRVHVAESGNGGVLAGPRPGQVLPGLLAEIVKREVHGIGAKIQEDPPPLEDRLNVDKDIHD